MRRLAILLSLVAAMTGSPLRQAEAAADFGRSVADDSQGAEFEAPDGGVGDDAGVGTLAAPLGLAAVAGDVAVLRILPPPSAFFATPAADEGLWERVWWPQSPPTLRFAWLQTFRF